MPKVELYADYSEDSREAARYLEEKGIQYESFFSEGYNVPSMAIGNDMVYGLDQIISMANQLMSAR